MEEFKKNINTTRKPDDVIKVILGNTSNNKIVKDPVKIHRAIYSLTKQDQWKPYLKDFYFNLSSISPFSDQLDQVISRLETSYLLSTPNPRYDSYTLQKDYLLEAMAKFDEEDHIILKEMAKEFEALISH